MSPAAKAFRAAHAAIALAFLGAIGAVPVLGLGTAAGVALLAVRGPTPRAGR